MFTYGKKGVSVKVHRTRHLLCGTASRSEPVFKDTRFYAEKDLVVSYGNKYLKSNQNK